MNKDQANKEYLENMAFVSEYSGFMSNAELCGWCKEQDRLWEIMAGTN